MANQLIERLTAIIETGEISRSGLARAAGLHPNSLRKLGAPDWNPTADTLGRLEKLLARGTAEVLVGPEAIINEARNGRMFILVDDDDRENEGDLIIPAQMATPDAINFMARHGRGLICLALTKDRVDALGLPLMTRTNGTRHETAFTVSIEAQAPACRPGSAPPTAPAPSRSPSTSANGPEELVSPGHVFPLVARPGGVLVRAGHTEAAVDVSRLAGLNPSGVICEIMREDGTMARLDDLIEFARAHGLKIGTIRDLIAYRLRRDHLVERVAATPFNSPSGREWQAQVFRDKATGAEQLALILGPLNAEEPVMVRMHSLDLFADVLGEPSDRQRPARRGDADDRGARLGRRRRASRRQPRLALPRGRPPGRQGCRGGRGAAQLWRRRADIGGARHPRHDPAYQHSPLARRPERLRPRHRRGTLHRRRRLTWPTS